MRLVILLILTGIFTYSAGAQTRLYQIEPADTLNTGVSLPSYEGWVPVTRLDTFGIDDYRQYYAKLADVPLFRKADSICWVFIDTLNGFPSDTFCVIDNTGASTYSWFVDTDNEVATEITDGETLLLSEGTNMTVVRSGNTITFSSTGADDDWYELPQPGSAPNDITDTIWTFGWVGIGLDTVRRPLDVEGRDSNNIVARLRNNGIQSAWLQIQNDSFGWQLGTHASDFFMLFPDSSGRQVFSVHPGAAYLAVEINDSTEGVNFNEYGAGNFQNPWSYIAVYSAGGQFREVSLADLRDSLDGVGIDSYVDSAGYNVAIDSFEFFRTDGTTWIDSFMVWSPYTRAYNGLTNQSFDSIKWGGTLVENTEIQGDFFSIDFDSLTWFDVGTGTTGGGGFRYEHRKNASSFFQMDFDESVWRYTDQDTINEITMGVNPNSSMRIWVYPLSDFGTLDSITGFDVAPNYIRVRPPSIKRGTAVNGQVLTLVTASNGEAEWATPASAVDSYIDSAFYGADDTLVLVRWDEFTSTWTDSVKVEIPNASLNGTPNTVAYYDANGDLTSEVGFNFNETNDKLDLAIATHKLTWNNPSTPTGLITVANNITTERVIIESQGTSGSSSRWVVNGSHAQAQIFDLDQGNLSNFENFKIRYNGTTDVFELDRFQDMYLRDGNINLSNNHGIYLADNVAAYKQILYMTTGNLVTLRDQGANAQFQLLTSGQTRMPQMGIGTFDTGAETYLLGVENDGDVVEVDLTPGAGVVDADWFVYPAMTAVPTAITDDIGSQGEIHAVDHWFSGVLAQDSLTSSRIAFPRGGSQTVNGAGAIRIDMPSAAGWDAASVVINLVIREDLGDAEYNLTLAGNLAPSTWSNVGVTAVSTEARQIDSISFGSRQTDVLPSIWLEDTSGSWSNANVTILDVIVYGTNRTVQNWRNGWNIVLDNVTTGDTYQHNRNITQILPVAEPDSLYVSNDTLFTFGGDFVVLPSTGFTGTGNKVVYTDPFGNLAVEATDNFGYVQTSNSFSTPINVLVGDGTSGSPYIEIGENRTGNGDAYIDFHSAEGYDFNAQLKANSGASPAFDIEVQGSGSIRQRINSGIRTELLSSGRWVWNGYTSVSSFPGIDVGILSFAAGGEINTMSFAELADSISQDGFGGGANKVVYTDANGVATVEATDNFSYNESTNAFSTPANNNFSTDVSTGAAVIELGGGRTGDGNAYIDLHSTSSVDYSFRIIRSGGADANTTFTNVGATGDIIFNANAGNRLAIQDNGQMRFYDYTTGTSFNGTDVGMLSFDGSGNVQTMSFQEVADSVENLIVSPYTWTANNESGDDFTVTDNFTVNFIGLGTALTVTGTDHGGSGTVEISYNDPDASSTNELQNLGIGIRTGTTYPITITSGTGATLGVFTNTLAGLAPSSGGGTTNFLRADGTWAAPGAASYSWALHVDNAVADATVTNGEVVDFDAVTVDATAGIAISWDGTGRDVDISHANTSSQTSVDNNGNTFIQDITLDTYGHITSIVSATASGAADGDGIYDGSGTAPNGTVASLTSGASVDFAIDHPSSIIDNLWFDDNSSVASGIRAVAAHALKIGNESWNGQDLEVVAENGQVILRNENATTSGGSEIRLSSAGSITLDADHSSTNQITIQSNDDILIRGSETSNTGFFELQYGSTPTVEIDITNDGAGINGAAPTSTYNLHVTGGIGVSGSTADKNGGGSWGSYSSDRRVKENIEYIDPAKAIEVIGKIRPATFQFTEYWRNVKGGIPADNHYHFIAQDIKEILPEAIIYRDDYLPNDPNPVMGLNNDVINAYQTAAVQQLIKDKRDMEARIDYLEQQIQSLIKDNKK